MTLEMDVALIVAADDLPRLAPEVGSSERAATKQARFVLDALAPTLKEFHALEHRPDR